MALTLTVLGSSGTYAGPDGACSGFLVRSDTTTLLLDAGPGTLANLQRHVPLEQLDGIVLSHSHPDHWLELPVLRNALKYVLGREGVPVHTTAETLGLAEQLCSGGLTPTFVPHVIRDGSALQVGDLTLRCSRTDHPVETLGVRVDADGRSLAYSADTGPGWSIGELGRVDLALCEATFLHDSADRNPVHLTAHQAGELSREARAGRLVLTHVLPTGSVPLAMEEAADAYGAPVEHAAMHRSFDV